MEIAYISIDALKTFKAKSHQIAIISLGEPFHIKEAEKDWLMNWFMVRENGVSLFGPPAKTIIAPISKEEFIQAVRENTREWGKWVNHSQDRKGQAYAILTLCRALYTDKTGEQASKKQAARWAQNQLPEWLWLIEKALKWREGWREENVNHEESFSKTKKFVHYVIDQMSS